MKNTNQQDNLQVKVLKYLIIPMITMLFLTALGAFVFLYFYYMDFLETKIDEMEEDEIIVLEILSSYSADTLGQWMDYASNFMLIAYTTTKGILNNTVSVKPNFSSTKYISAVEVAKNTNLPEGWDESTKSSTKISMWYLDPYTDSTNLNYDAIIELKQATIMDSYNIPIGRSNPYIDSSKDSLHVTFDHTGLFYVFPTYSSETFIDTSYEYPDGCGYVDPDPDWYDPRCGDWYTNTIKNPDNSITTTGPYQFATVDQIGQTICYTILQDSTATTTKARIVECLDYTLKRLHDQLKLSRSASAYTTSYAYTSELNLIYHSNMFQYDDSNSYNIEMLEFDGNTGDEFKYWEKNVLPLFISNEATTATYYTNGKKVIIAITPVLYRTTVDGEPSQYGGYGIRVAIDGLRSNYEELKDTCMNTLFVDILLFIPMTLGIMIICYIVSSYQMTKLLRPLNRLVNILDRMMNGELEIQEFSNKRKVCIEVIQLYNVFDRLRILLRLRSDKYFENDANAIIMYSQALLLFKDFGNTSGTALCWYNIGVINYKNQRYEEAAEALYNSIQECGFENHRSPREELNFMRRIETYTKALRALHKNQEALYFLYLLAEYYKNNSKDLHDILRVLMQIIEINSILGQDSSDLIKDMEEFIYSYTYSSMPKSIVYQLLAYCQALNCIPQQAYKQAAKLLSDVLDSFELYCPEIRNKALATLKYVFNKLELDICIDSILSYSQYEGKDIMMLIDCSEQVDEDTMNMAKSCFTNLYFRSIYDKDRVSCIFFNDEINFVTRLSKLNSTADIFLQKLRDGFTIKGRRALYDAIISSINDCKTFSGHLSMSSQSIEIQPTFRDNWVIVFISGPDTASKRSQSEILETLKDFSSGIVLIGYKLESSVQETFHSMVEEYSRAHFLNCCTPRELNRAFELVTSIICGRSNLI